MLLSWSVLPLVFLLVDIAVLQGSYGQGINILHLGDSFSSGSGARNSNGIADYEGVRHCRRSPSNWGAPYAAAMAQTYNVTYTNRACGGAKLKDIWNPKELYGQRPRLFCPPKRRWKDDLFFERTGPFRCTKYVEAQLDMVDESVDLVFLTLGLNDIGFSPIVVSCFVNFYFGSARRCHQSIEESYEKLSILGLQTENALLDLWDRMGQSGKIVWFGYPHTILNVSDIRRDPLTHSEVDAPQEVRRFNDALNAQLEQAVEKANTVAGVEFAIFWGKTAALFEGHEARPDNFRVNPDRWIHEIAPRVFESLHPNPKGYEAWANAVVEEGIFGLENDTT